MPSLPRLYSIRSIPLEGLLNHFLRDLRYEAPLVYSRKLIFLFADEDEGQGNLEPISSDNIIQGGRRTRGKNIDFQEAAEKTKNEEVDDDDDDEDFAPQDNDEENDDDQMRD